jgi:hypothetical protein
MSNLVFLTPIVLGFVVFAVTLAWADRTTHHPT